MLLELLGICQHFNKLPRDGGVLDQDSLFIYLMKFAVQWQEDKRELDHKKQSRG